MKRCAAIALSPARVAVAALALWLTAATGFGHAEINSQSDPDPASYLAPAAAGMPYAEFLAHVDRKDIREVTVRGHTLVGVLADGEAFRTDKPEDPAILATLSARGVPVTVAPESEAALKDLSVMVIAVLVLMGTAFCLIDPKADGVARTLSARPAFRQATPAAPGPTFDDVAGVDEAREEVEEIVEFLSQPEKFLQLGGRVPRGCLLVGPPGSGKTLLARAIAGEAKVPFIAVSGSEFVEMYVGVGASRVRDLFDQARSVAPCIVFIDEIDAVGKRRGASVGGASDEREQTLNQLLVEMDGVEHDDQVIVIAATNRVDVLDPALLRPGRFDRQVIVRPPDVAGRERILEVHLRKVAAAADVDIAKIARATPGCSGAELAALVNDAALAAGRVGATAVAMRDLEWAAERLLMGPERRSRAITPEDRERAACHESGHALVALAVPGSDRLHKVTIAFRGRALGRTMLLPEHDTRSVSRQQMLARMATLMAGRVAEELVYGADGVTSDAEDDIGRATALARQMVTELGFSDALGPVHYSITREYGLAGMSAVLPGVSDATTTAIDAEVFRIVVHAKTTARRVLTAQLADLRRLASALVDRETLSGEEIRHLLDRGADRQEQRIL